MLSDTLSRFRILPAITFENTEHAVPVTESLINGGLQLMEIQFRSAAAADSINIIRKKFPEVFIGAGTILTLDHLRQSVDAGAMFGLSPAFNPRIVEEAVKLKFPFIPGVFTPSEIEAANEMGCGIQKLFPAEQSGGAKFLKAVLAPYDQLNIRFIPMGGVNPSNMKEYLSLKNVIAVGGSWLATKDLIAAGDFTQIEKNAREAVALV